MSDLSSLQDLCGSHWKSRSTVGFCGKCHNPKIIDNSQALTGQVHGFFHRFRCFSVPPSAPSTSFHDHLQLIELVGTNPTGVLDHHLNIGWSAAQRTWSAASCLGLWDAGIQKSSTLLCNGKIIQVITQRMPQLMSPFERGEIWHAPKKADFVNQPIHMKNMKNKKHDKHWINPKAARAREGSASLPRRRREEKHLSH